jgi:NADPH2:quinone reductase
MKVMAAVRFQETGQDFRGSTRSGAAFRGYLQRMSMQAVVYERYGPPEVLELREYPKPEPGRHEVLVRVGATTVTAACGMMRRGDTLLARLLLGIARPRRRFRVMGIEIAGVVERAGAGVTRFRPGDRVFGFTGFAAGGYAEFTCLSEDAALVATPTGLSDGEACTLVDGPTTALFFLRERGDLRAGERIAVIGAAGSVGTAAVQLAKHFGAEVTAVCSGANADLVRSLGAHHVIDYARQDYSMLGERFDVVFDAVGKSSFERAKRCLVPGGRYLLTVGGLGAPLRDAWSRVFESKRLIYGMSIDKRELLPQVARLVSRGALRPVIDRTYSLSNIVEAHRYVDTGHKRGNVVVTVRQ